MSDFKPFEDKQKVKDIEEYRDKLIKDLEDFDIPDTEKLFIIKKVQNITEKLLEKARYGK